jgi:hypothetical protein
MNGEPALTFEIGYAVYRRMIATAKRVGASRQELEALERMSCFRGTEEDVKLLSRLAALTGLPWSQMFRCKAQLLDLVQGFVEPKEDP